AARRADQRGDRRRISVELFAVAADELAPPLGLMFEPAAQGHAGGDVLQPQVDGGVRLVQATRPEAIDEDAHAIVLRRRFVCTLYLNGWGRHGLNLFCHDYN